MTNVLLLDLEPRREFPPFQAYRWLPEGTAHTKVVAWTDEIPTSPGEHTHLILSGSSVSITDDHPPTEPAMQLGRALPAAGRPICGICYGHQLIARALLGPEHVCRAPRQEYGWYQVQPLAELALFADLPDPFRVFMAHNDMVCDLPDDWQVIARTEQCAIQGMINHRRRILGFQFHPEMSLEVGNTCFSTAREELERDGFDVDAIVAHGREDGSGALLFPRFLEYDWPDYSPEK